MSKPKRYTAAGSGVVRTDPEGDLVLYVDYLRLLIEVDELKSQPDPLTAYLYAAELAKDDYARLKAEVERLTKDLEYREDLALRVKRITDQFTAPEVLLLRAQVERLTKAGDAFVLLLEDEGYSMESIREVETWNAAKEGKQP